MDWKSKHKRQEQIRGFLSGTNNILEREGRLWGTIFLYCCG